MLQIKVGGIELFDEGKNEFYTSNEQVLQLEHSLVSLSKWESRWQKPFLSKEKKSYQETLDYIRCMTITQNVNPDIYSYRYISSNVIDEVNKYIENPMTATTFGQTSNQKPNREIITAEIIYYWMITYNVPFECQKWHLNRLLTLINVCNIKNQPSKKMNKKHLLQQNHAINTARRASTGSKG